VWWCVWSSWGASLDGWARTAPHVPPPARMLARCRPPLALKRTPARARTMLITVAASSSLLTGTSGCVRLGMRCPSACSLFSTCG
jgi:hypothetical protein